MLPRRLRDRGAPHGGSPGQARRRGPKHRDATTARAPAIQTAPGPPRQCRPPLPVSPRARPAVQALAPRAPCPHPQDADTSLVSPIRGPVHTTHPVPLQRHRHHRSASRVAFDVACRIAGAANVLFKHPQAHSSADASCALHPAPTTTVDDAMSKDARLGPLIPRSGAQAAKPTPPSEAGSRR